MFGYLIITIIAIGVFWLDPILRAVSPSLVSDAPVIPWTPRPPINESLLALEGAGLDNPGGPASETDDAHCEADAYTVHIYNRAPLVLYIEDFLSATERQYLLDLSEPLYAPATVTHDGNTTLRNTLVRDSEVALVPRTQTVRCIEARARRLQGWREEMWIERLRVQRYGAPSGHYGFHFDWSRSGAATGGWGRVSSLMVFVDDGAATGETLVGGGTYFPRLPRRRDSRWCRWIGCETESDTERKAGSGTGSSIDPEIDPDTSAGVVFQPIPGNAVFWENFRPDGTGRAFEETWHAGLRVRQGVKVGLNIWSWGRVD